MSIILYIINIYWCSIMAPLFFLNYWIQLLKKKRKEFSIFSWPEKVPVVLLWGWRQNLHQSDERAGDSAWETLPRGKRKSLIHSPLHIKPNCCDNWTWPWLTYQRFYQPLSPDVWITTTGGLNRILKKVRGGRVAPLPSGDVALVRM